jgi:hypothetical protein
MQCQYLIIYNSYEASLGALEPTVALVWHDQVRKGKVREVRELKTQGPKNPSDPHGIHAARRITRKVSHKASPYPCTVVVISARSSSNRLVDGGWRWLGLDEVGGGRSTES